MKALIILLFSFIVASLQGIPSEEAKKVSFFQSCVIPKIDDKSGGQTVVNFYNLCSEKVYINACLADSSGEIKLYKSFRPIPLGGKFTIYTFPSVILSDLHWVADITDPGIPPMCAG